MPGLFISLDGIDGTGKSTICRHMAQWLRQKRLKVTTCTDPGGTPLGDQLRALVLDKQYQMTPACEAFLFMASRAELVAQVIRPALDADHVVISDRFLLANVVYQGHAGGLPVEDLWRIGRLATGGLEPDVTLVLDLPVEAALARRGRSPDRMESRDRDYQERVRAGFRAEAERNPETIRLIDAKGDVADVEFAIGAALEPWISARLRSR